MSRRPQSAEDLALRTFLDASGRKVVGEVASRTLGKTPDAILAEIEKLPLTKEQKAQVRIGLWFSFGQLPLNELDVVGLDDTRRWFFLVALARRLGFDLEEVPDVGDFEEGTRSPSASSEVPAKATPLDPPIPIDALQDLAEVVAASKAGVAATQSPNNLAWGRRKEFHAAVLEALRALGGSGTRADVFHAIDGRGIGPTTRGALKDAVGFSLTYLQRAGKLSVRGAGGSRDPFVYWIKTDAPC